MGDDMKKIIGILIIMLMAIPVLSENLNSEVIDEESENQLIGQNHAKKTYDSQQQRDQILQRNGATPQVEWMRTYDINGKRAQCFSLWQTDDGGYALIGLANYNYQNHGCDILLLKTDTNGHEQWNKTYTIPSYYKATGFSGQQTSDGGYIITGYAKENTDCGDVFLMKTDGNGNIQWTKMFGGEETDYAYEVEQTSDDGYIIVGSTSTYTIYAHDVWLIKTDTNGNEQWNKTFGINPSYKWCMDQGFSVNQTTDGGYIITGYAFPYADVQCWLVWLIKTDAHGNILWDNLFQYPGAYNQMGHSVRQTTDGGYIIAAHAGPVSNQNTEIWLIKTDANGNEQWNRTYGRENNCDYGYSVQQTTDGGYIVVGFTRSIDDRNDDGIVIKTDTNGSEQWNMTFEGDNEHHGFGETFKSVQQTSDGGYIIGGWTANYGADVLDAFVVKLTMEDIENDPPNTPTRPSGPSSGRPNTLYSYSTNTTDPNSDDLIQYYFNWGDGTNSGWIGLYNSGEICIASHKWEAQGTYEIKVKARDFHLYESDWSDSVIIYIDEDTEPPNVTILKPENALYIKNKKILPLLKPLMIGSIDITVDASDEETGIDRVEFYIDSNFRYTDYDEPYNWTWDERTPLRFRHTITIIAYDNVGNSANDEIDVRKFL